MGRHEQALMMEGATEEQKMHQPAGDLLIKHPSNASQLQTDSDKHNQTAHKNKRSYCWRRTCFLVSFLVALLVAASVVLCTFKALEPDPHGCQGGWWPTASPSQYPLFGTKTSYANALSQLLPATSQPPYTPISAPFDAAHQSTQQLHQQLTDQQGCTVKQLHLFARHAARYPSSYEWANISLLISQLQALIELHKFQPPPESDIPANIQINNNSTSAVQVNASQLCFNPLAQYKHWLPFMEPTQANQVTQAGALETRAMALRYATLYPNLFNSFFKRFNARGPLIGVTGEQRTAQTAINFVAALGPLNVSTLASLKLDQCDQATFHQLNTNPHQVYDSDCFRNFAQANIMKRLQFHEQCQHFSRDDHPTVFNLNLTTSPWLTPIAAELANKLKLDQQHTNNNDDNNSANKQPPLSHQQLKAIYQVCKYETALNANQPPANSIWCNLFTQQQLQFLEYVDDVDDFFSQAYGHPNQAQSACLITTELLRTLKYFRKNQQEEVNLYFTHSQVIQRLIAAAVDLEHDEAYSQSVIQKHLSAGKVPKMARHWRTSLMTPFSANLAFTVYECPSSAGPSPNSRIAPQNAPDSDIDPPSPYKLVASLNERPILMDGCSSVACDLGQFIDQARFNRDKKCKLEEICRKKVIVN